MNPELKYYVKQNEAVLMGADMPCRWKMTSLKWYATKEEATQAYVDAPKASYYQYETNAPKRKSVTTIAKERGWDDIPDHVETAYKSAIRGMTAPIGIVESAGGEDEMMMGGTE